MNILVTGSKGFIGKNLVSFLENIKNGNDMVHSDIQIDEIFGYDVAEDLDLLNEYCGKTDFVFHLAGVNRPKNSSEFKTGNVEFLGTLLSMLKSNDNRCPVMLASSIQAILDNPYGNSKRAAEELLLKYSEETGAKSLIYRFPNVFGKWCVPNYNSVIATFCYNIANGLPITVNDPKTKMTLVYIDDLICELLNALLGMENRDGDYCSVPVFYETDLGSIARTIEGFPDMKLSLDLPNLDNVFVKKLYSTYLSYIPEDKTIYDLKMNIDSRGYFAELFRTANKGQFSVNVCAPGITRGNHWHHTKCEKFIVVSGEGMIRMRKVGKDKAGNHYPVVEYRVSGEKIQVIEIIPGYAHSITNLSDKENLVTIMWANECFDPNYPDTFKENV